MDCAPAEWHVTQNNFPCPCEAPCVPQDTALPIIASCDPARTDNYSTTTVRGRSPLPNWIHKGWVYCAAIALPLSLALSPTPFLGWFLNKFFLCRLVNQPSTISFSYLPYNTHTPLPPYESIKEFSARGRSTTVFCRRQHAQQPGTALKIPNEDNGLSRLLGISVLQPCVSHKVLCSRFSAWGGGGGAEILNLSNIN
jgi:hypothetical protein